MEHPPDVTEAGGRQAPGQPGMRAVAVQHSHLPPLTDCRKKVEVACSWPSPARGGLRNVSGIAAAGECISSQLAYWKRNELIRQASLNLNGNTTRWGGRAGRGFCPSLGSGAWTPFHLRPCPRSSRVPWKAAMILNTTLLKPRANVEEGNTPKKNEA